MDISEIRKLIRLVQQSDVTEIEVTEGKSTVRISRQSSAPVMVAAAQQPMIAAPAAAATSPTTSPSLIETPPEVCGENVVKSPMVGTFYAASSPDDDPFISIGSSVKKGDVICIVEAMKLMNEIEAEYDGTVEKVLVKNADPLEYGQPLFVITPA
ncbi:MAG: acetyl-CoA carboxylase biotin carboxyl carrier protein [Ghiorsea sp.]|nr:acetyl-CoA carboxylase biotin carboxyl carrier protein [Ghiorsea sp.]